MKSKGYEVKEIMSITCLSARIPALSCHFITFFLYSPNNSKTFLIFAPKS